MKDHAPINEKIRADKMQVITSEGQNLGIISKKEALKLAEQASLDLVIISEKGNEGLPVAKIMDYGKLLYSKKKKAADAKKKQKVIKVKEIKIRPKISDHDLHTKLNHSIDFLKEGNRVKFTLMFKGREVANKTELGEMLFNKIDTFLIEANLKNLTTEKDVKMGQIWSRLYYLKS